MHHGHHGLQDFRHSLFKSFGAHFRPLQRSARFASRVLPGQRDVRHDGKAQHQRHGRLVPRVVQLCGPDGGRRRHLLALQLERRLVRRRLRAARLGFTRALWLCVGRFDGKIFARAKCLCEFDEAFGLRPGPKSGTLRHALLPRGRGGHGAVPRREDVRRFGVRRPRVDRGGRSLLRRRQICNKIRRRHADALLLRGKARRFARRIDLCRLLSNCGHQDAALVGPGDHSTLAKGVQVVHQARRQPVMDRPAHDRGHCGRQLVDLCALQRFRKVRAPQLRLFGSGQHGGQDFRPHFHKHGVHRASF
mmetsp:Transcript_23950/g.85502  ORF Transcript_23950/g.85502 Transcript_23950/m.85502 type:complete len:305 (-) Transcript_23950:1327-2241(-)